MWNSEPGHRCTIYKTVVRGTHLWVSTDDGTNIETINFSEDVNGRVVWGRTFYFRNSELYRFGSEGYGAPDWENRPPLNPEFAKCLMLLGRQENGLRDSMKACVNILKKPGSKYSGGEESNSMKHKAYMVLHTTSVMASNLLQKPYKLVVRVLQDNLDSKEHQAKVIMPLLLNPLGLSLMMAQMVREWSLEKVIETE